MNELILKKKHNLRIEKIYLIFQLYSHNKLNNWNDDRESESKQVKETIRFLLPPPIHPKTSQFGLDILLSIMQSIKKNSENSRFKEFS